MKELEYTTQSVPKGKRFCTICGEIKREHYFEGDSTHCSACCEKMLHTRLNVRYMPFVLLLLPVIAVSVFLSVYTLPYGAELFRADAIRRDDRIADACTAYLDVINQASDVNARIQAHGKLDSSGNVPIPSGIFFEAGARTWAHYLDTYASLYSEYEAASVASGSLDADTVARIPAIARWNEAKQAYEQTLAFAEEHATDFPDDMTRDEQYDKIIAELTAFADESDSRYVKGYVEYYKGRASQYYKPDDLSVSTAFYDKMLDYLPNEFMTAYSSEADAAMAVEDYEAAIEAYEKILARNKNYTDAYSLIAQAAFLAGNDEKLASALAYYDEDDPLRLQLEMRFALRSDDLDKAAEVRARAEKTIKIKADQAFNNMLADQAIDEENKEILMSYISFSMENAAYSLVRGEPDEAYGIAYEEAFNDVYYYGFITSDTEAFSQPVINMATLCASLVQDKDALKTIKEIGPCDDATQQVIDGELTVREVFVEGKAEII